MIETLLATILFIILTGIAVLIWFMIYEILSSGYLKK